MPVAESFRLFLPEIFLLTGAFALFLLDLFVRNKKSLGLLALLILCGTILLSKTPAVSTPLFFGFFTLDPITHVFKLIALTAVSITILVSLAYKPLNRDYEGEYYGLFLLMAFALTLMAASTHLLMIFMSVEFVSVISYLLVGFLKKSFRAKEASIKYFLYGSFCSGILLYGLSILYGISGSLELKVIYETLRTLPPLWPALTLAMLFFFVGLGFKISMAPFHMWAPDVYEAAPTPVSGFLTVAPKALGFAILIRLLSSAFLPLGFKWQGLLIFFSILTMTIGNVIALGQTNIKRLLAYSSIAQAGYILMGLSVFNELGLNGVLVYLTIYTFTNLGAFAVITAVSNHTGSDEIESYAGLSKRSPALSASLTVFLLSLAGLPPMAGFIGKFYVFSAALQAGFISMAVAAAINSAVAAFYYFKIVRVMYLKRTSHHESILETHLTWVAGALALVVFLLGLFPASLIEYLKGMLLV